MVFYFSTAIQLYHNIICICTFYGLPEWDYGTIGSLLSQIPLLTNIYAMCPTQEVETFDNISTPFCTLAILWPLCKILRRLSQGNPSIRGVKRNRGTKIQWCHVWVSHLLMSFLYPVAKDFNVCVCACVCVHKKWDLLLTFSNMEDLHRIWRGNDMT